MFKCYNCGSEANKKEVICRNCNFLSKEQFNYFEIFSLEKRFEIDDLDSRYLNLQKIVHPDNFYNKAAIEKDLALKLSSIANEAYKVLKDERSRAQYLLSLQDINVNTENDNIKPSENLLLEVFLTRNMIEESADLPAMLLLQEKNNKKCKQLLQEFKMQYAQNNLQDAGQAVIYIRYLEKIAAEITNKIIALKK